MLTLCKIVGVVELVLIAIAIVAAFPINRVIQRERAAGARVYVDGAWVRKS